MLQRPLPIETVDATEHPEHAEAFDLREIVSFVWRQWKFIASVVGIIVLIATAYVARKVPLYTANALVLLNTQRERNPLAVGDTQGIDLNYAAIDSQIAIIKSVTFLRRVVEKEHLVSDPEFGSAPAPAQTPQSRSLFARIKSLFIGSKNEKPAPKPSPSNEKSKPPNEMASVWALMGALTVSRRGEGYVLSIGVTSVDPNRAARLANAVANAYVVEKLNARFEAAKRASGWLGDRLVELRKQLQKSEEAVVKFRAAHGLVQSTGNISLNDKQLADLNQNLVQARTDLAQKKARLDLVRSTLAKGGSIQSLPDLPGASELASLRKQEVDIAQKEADLVARYSARHPLVVNIRAQDRDIKRAIAAQLKRSAASVNDDYELAKARVKALEQELQEATGQGGAGDQTAVTLHELERTAEVNKTLFDNFLQKAKITQQQATFEAPDARVITPAVAPGGPSYPRTSHTISVALFIGLMLGVGGAFAREKLNSGFTTPRQVEKMLTVPMLASVSTISSNELVVDGKEIPIPYCPILIPLCRHSESIRTLRSSIQMTDVDDPPKVIQLTSTVPNEGKTTIGLSIAASAAAAGQKVLFIDADLRHPSASRFFSRQKEKGLVDLLIGRVGLQDVVKHNQNTGLWVLPAGENTRNPTDLLGSERMKTVVSSCKNLFDLVLIDTPPIGPVSDPIIVSHIADKVVYVIRWASTAREIVQQSLHRLPGNRKVAGVVFNLVDDRQAQKYGKDAYSYYYGVRDYRKYYSS